MNNKSAIFVFDYLVYHFRVSFLSGHCDGFLLMCSPCLRNIEQDMYSQCRADIVQQWSYAFLVATVQVQLMTSWRRIGICAVYR